MLLKTKKTIFLPAVVLMIAVASVASALIIPVDSAMALNAEQCRDKYNANEIKGKLSNEQLRDDKCALDQGGPCGGRASAGAGYWTCPDTAKADTFCKKKYPDNAANRNACRSGYFSTIFGCLSFSGDKKKACETGEKEFERVSAEAAEPDDDGDGLSDPVAGSDCGGVETAIIKCDADNSGTDMENNGVWALLMIVLNILTAGVGIVAVGGIVYGAVLYTTAEDKADQVKKATDIITNVVIGIIAFALMWAGLNFIVPGGVFN